MIPNETLESPEATTVRFDPNIIFFESARTFNIEVSCYTFTKTSKSQPSEKVEKQYAPFTALNESHLNFCNIF